MTISEHPKEPSNPSAQVLQKKQDEEPSHPFPPTVSDKENNGGGWPALRLRVSSFLPKVRGIEPKVIRKLEWLQNEERGGNVEFAERDLEWINILRGVVSDGGSRGVTQLKKKATRLLMEAAGLKESKLWFFFLCSFLVANIEVWNRNLTTILG